MSFAMYEPMDTMGPQVPAGGLGQMPGQLEARKPVPQGQGAAAQGPQVPAPQPTASQWQDISDYEENLDWVHILLAILIVDILVIVLIRHFPDTFGRWINLWYNRFGLLAVLADVFIIAVGFAIARYVYSEYIYPKADWSALFFTGTTVGVQLLHDILFYFGVILPIPSGTNSMIDVFKQYAESGGAKILAADAAMMVGSSVIAMILKAAPFHAVITTGLVAIYALPYVLTTRNQYSNMS
jgi:hypothetical protein